SFKFRRITFSHKPTLTAPHFVSSFMGPLYFDAAPKIATERNQMVRFSSLKRGMNLLSNTRRRSYGIPESPS
ncbi:hypothetical protein, partial [Heyndrickxia coagulans]